MFEKSLWTVLIGYLTLHNTRFNMYDKTNHRKINKIGQKLQNQTKRFLKIKKRELRLHKILYFDTGFMSVFSKYCKNFDSRKSVKIFAVYSHSLI